MTSPDAIGEFARLLAKAPDEVGADITAQAYDQLIGFLIVRFALPHNDAAEIASEAVLSFLRAATSGRIEASSNPAGYLITTAQRKAVDHLRTTHRESAACDKKMFLIDHRDDDNVAQALERHATAELVRQSLTRARTQGDKTLYIVVTFILDEITKTGVRPSNREAARELGVSHTAVANALARLRQYVRQLSTPQ